MGKFWSKKIGNYLSILLLGIFLSVYIVELKIIDLSFFLILGLGLAILDLFKK